MTYPQMIAERVRKQAAASNTQPARLLLEELMDMQRAYTDALAIITKESSNVDSNSQRVPD